MSKGVVFNVPAYGHVNPTLAVVQALVARGEEVVYYLTEPFRETIEATGATFRPYATAMMGAGTQPVSSANVPSNMPVMMIDETLRLVPELMDRVRAEHADYAIYDPMCLWGRILMEKLHIPAIVFRPSYAVNEHVSLINMNAAPQMGGWQQMMDTFATAAERLRALDVEPPRSMVDIFGHATALNIVTIPRAFQTAGDTFDARFVFVGPCIQPRHESITFPLERLRDQPTLFISLGTVFNNQLAFFRECLAAFGNSAWQVVLGIGTRVDQGALGAIPENVLLAPYVPQLDVLQHSSVFVTHGGMNSTMEALYYGVPLVVVPQMPEQAATARRVAELGLGVALNGDTLSVDVLQQAVERVAHDPGIRQRVEAMQHAVREAGGYERAADAIVAFAATTVPA